MRDGSCVYILDKTMHRHAHNNKKHPHHVSIESFVLSEIEYE